MKKKIHSIPKDKKCRCGRKITHHHFLCDDCWREDKKTSKLRRNAMKKKFKLTQQNVLRDEPIQNR